MICADRRPAGDSGWTRFDSGERETGRSWAGRIWAGRSWAGRSWAGGAGSAVSNIRSISPPIRLSKSANPEKSETMAKRRSSTQFLEPFGSDVSSESAMFFGAVVDMLALRYLRMKY